MTRLNLTHLATLLEFARRGTLGAAAESLGYTAGAASQHVAALERAVGAPLIRKTGRNRVLTDAGQALVEHANAVLRAERAAVRAAVSAHDAVSGPLTVGTWGSTAATLLAPIVRDLAEEWPAVSLRSREVDLDSTLSAVVHGDLDIAFGLDYPDAPLPRHPDVAILPLGQEPFSIASAGPPRRKPRPMTDAELRDLAWILPPVTSRYGRAVLDGLRRRDVEPRVVHEVTDTAAALQLASSGLGATVVTPLMLRLAPRTDLCVRPMADPILRELVLIAPRRDRPRAVDAFVAVARRVLPTVDGGC